MNNGVNNSIELHIRKIGPTLKKSKLTDRELIFENKSKGCN